jgi:sulfite reductase beta subunit-like hemoprotein
MRERAIVEAEIQHLERQIERLKSGELDAELFKKIRLQYGIYSMRRSPTGYMVRVRIQLGIITPEQLDALATICETLTPSASCHLTTRQDVQLYGIERTQLVKLLRQLAAVGLTTREASGNVVRNVTCCPWAGVAADEPFDVTPYAQAISDYLLRNPLIQLLPRKVKIAFEGCPTDHAKTAIHDIGLVGAPKDGQIGFRIYAGGGLGPMPRAAQLLEPWTSLEHLLPTVEAILRVFDRFGERSNRAKARLKFLVEQLGWDTFKQRVLEERSLVWATQSGCALGALKVHLDATITRNKAAAAPLPCSEALSDGMRRWSATNVLAQKQAGLFSVMVRVPLGDVSAYQLRGVASIAKEHTCEARLTNEQNLLLRFVPDASLWRVYEALCALKLAEPGALRVVDVTRCPGADSCLSAITRPRGLAQEIERMCNNGLSQWADAPLSIKISGCPNSCGHHHIADIGFFGMAIKAGERHVPCYQILVGGGLAQGSAQFAQRLIRVPAQRAPEALKRLIKFYHAQKQPGEGFAAFVARIGQPPLEELLTDLADLSDAAKTAELFVDLGATEPFELEAGKGECAE